MCEQESTWQGWSGSFACSWFCSSSSSSLPWISWLALLYTLTQVGPAVSHPSLSVCLTAVSVYVTSVCLTLSVWHLSACLASVSFCLSVWHLYLSDRLISGCLVMFVCVICLMSVWLFSGLSDICLSLQYLWLTWCSTNLMPSGFFLIFFLEWTWLVMDAKASTQLCLNVDNAHIHTHTHTHTQSHACKTAVPCLYDEVDLCLQRVAWLGTMRSTSSTTRGRTMPRGRGSSPSSVSSSPQWQAFWQASTCPEICVTPSTIYPVER